MIENVRGIDTLGKQVDCLPLHHILLRRLASHKHNKPTKYWYPPKALVFAKDAGLTGQYDSNQGRTKCPAGPWLDVNRNHTHKTKHGEPYG